MREAFAALRSAAARLLKGEPSVSQRERLNKDVAPPPQTA
jgi:hypothetical protein